MRSNSSDADRRVEPWPLAMAALLLFMVATSCAFLGVALLYPDPPVVEDSYAAGLEYNAGLKALEQRQSREASPLAGPSPKTSPTRQAPQSGARSDATRSAATTEVP